jgi:phage FluMu protein Com
MGNWFQRVVDQDASLDEAQELAAKILEILIDQEIIEAKLKECGLSGNRMGYPPGPNFEQIVDNPDCGIHELKVNGLQIIVERTVFEPGQGKLELICPQCKSRNSVDRAWADAVTEWYSNIGDGILRCPHCNYIRAVTEWYYEPVIAFGNLGFEFWNWPPLSKSFLTYLSQQLAHRTVYVTGKL